MSQSQQESVESGMIPDYAIESSFFRRTATTITHDSHHLLPSLAALVQLLVLVLEYSTNTSKSVNSNSNRVTVTAIGTVPALAALLVHYRY
jgi:hypothetical protein